MNKAYTVFMVPYYFEEGEWKNIHKNKLNKWKLAEGEFLKSRVLYPYVKDLFGGKDVPANRLFEMYEFDFQNKGTNSDLFVERILGKKSIAVIAENANARQNPQQISFTLCNDGNFAPHVFVSESAHIGILMFCVELDAKATLDDVKTLNYCLHKRNKTKNYQCICVYPENQGNADYSKELDSLLKQKILWEDDGGNKRLNQYSTRNEEKHLVWNLDDFVNCILGTMGKPKEGELRVSYFNDDNLHLFNYCSFDDIDDSLSQEDIMKESLKLSRCVNDKFLLPFDQLIDQGAILQTYENIYFSSSIEGASMICVAKKDNTEFIRQMHNIFQREYLLIYVLTLLQRYTLLGFERKLTQFKSFGATSDKALWDLIDTVCRIKVNCYYTDVSIYTHYYQFYQHCCKNLHIPETFDEIGEKIELLKLTTDRGIQRSQRFLSFIVALLTVAQMIQAAYYIISNKNDCVMQTSLCLGAAFILVLIFIMRKDIMKLFPGKS